MDYKVHKLNISELEWQKIQEELDYQDRMEKLAIEEFEREMKVEKTKSNKTTEEKIKIFRKLFKKYKKMLK